MKLPEITLKLNRLVGAEVEVDCGGAASRQPGHIDGWTSVGDGSLVNGREWVMSSPVKQCDAAPIVQRACDSWKAAGSYMGLCGGTHVHVSAADVLPGDLAKIYALYCHYFDEFKGVFGNSRINNFYCKKHGFDDAVKYANDYAAVIGSSENREQAKSCRHSIGYYGAINFGYMRCSNPAHRTIEFRQFSATSDFTSLFGWMTFATWLVEYVVTHRDLVTVAHGTVKINGFVPLELNEFLPETLSRWVKWRTNYLHRQPTKEEINSVIEHMTLNGRPVGLFTVGRVAGVNLSVASSICDHLAAERLVKLTVYANPSRAGTFHKTIFPSAELKMKTYTLTNPEIGRAMDILNGVSPKPKKLTKLQLSRLKKTALIEDSLSAVPAVDPLAPPPPPAAPAVRRRRQTTDEDGEILDNEAEAEVAEIEGSHE